MLSHADPMPYGHYYGCLGIRSPDCTGTVFWTSASSKKTGRTTESLFIYWMKCHNKEQFLISNRLHTIPIQIKESLKMCHHFCRNIKQRNHFQHVLKHNLYHESLHWFIFQCGLRSNFLIWPFWFCSSAPPWSFTSICVCVSLCIWQDAAL